MKEQKMKQKPLSAIKERTAEKVAGGILYVQRKWVKAMERLCARMTLRQQKVALICFSILMLAISVEAVFSAFIANDSRPVTIQEAGQLQMPVLIPREQAPVENNHLLASKIDAFERYLDSLETTVSGRLEKQRLLRQHPGLLDSLKKVKAIYGLMGGSDNGMDTSDMHK